MLISVNVLIILLIFRSYVFIVIVDYDLCCREQKRNMIDLQYRTFYCQSMLSITIYVPTFITIAILVNFYPCFRYDSNLILNNTEFNIAICISILTGFFSIVFARNPRWLSKLFTCERSSNIKHTENTNEQRLYHQIWHNKNHVLENVEAFKTMERKGIDGINRIHTKHYSRKSKIKTSLETEIPNQRISSLCQCSNQNTTTSDKKCKRLLPKKAWTRLIVSIASIALVTSPIIIAGIWFDVLENGTAYIYFTYLNETKIIQVIAIKGLNTKS